jgi:hypothetical protein
LLSSLFKAEGKAEKVEKDFTKTEKVADNIAEKGATKIESDTNIKIDRNVPKETINKNYNLPDNERKIVANKTLKDN